VAADLKQREIVILEPVVIMGLGQPRNKVLSTPGAQEMADGMTDRDGTGRRNNKSEGSG